MPRLKNSKAKGNRQEHRTMALLESQGYRCSRSAASLGAWDIFALGPKDGDVVLVQVKSSRRPGSEELARLRAFEVPSNVRKLIHVWKPYQREPEVEEI